MWIKTSTFCESISDGSSIWRNLIGGAHTHTHKKYVQIAHKKYDHIAKKRQKAKKRGNWLFNLSIKYENITTRFTQSTKLKHVHLQIIYTIWMCVLYLPHRWAHNSVASATWNRITGLIYTIVDFYNFNWFSATKTESINKTTLSIALRQHTQRHTDAVCYRFWWDALSWAIEFMLLPFNLQNFRQFCQRHSWKPWSSLAKKKCALYDNDYIWVGALKTCSQLHATNEHFN